MQINFFDFKIRGIDVSKYDLKMVVDKLVGKVHFVICRIGHGTKTDPLFKAFWVLLKGKVFRLSYFYLDYYSNYMPEFPAIYGMSDYDWGVVQAKNAWNNIKDDHDNAMVYLDIEDGDPDYALPVSSVWARVEAVMDGFFDEYGRLSNKVAGIYTSLSVFKNFSQRFRNHPAWVAWYNEDQTRESVLAAMNGWKVHFWQYASNGDVGTDNIGDGLEYGLGRRVMDLDVWMGTEAEWKEFTGMGDILLNIPALGQRDMRWSGNQLGTSNTTIGSHGCVITSATMMCRYFGIDIDPAGMNAWLKKNGGYSGGNLFYWAVLNKLDKRIAHAYRYDKAVAEKVDASLAKGIPVIVNVDMNPATSYPDEHWVLVVGKVNGSYIINDPWYGTQFKLEDKYKEMRIAETYTFTGELAPLPEPEPEKVLYQVRVKIDNLLIRSGAGATYPVVHRYATGVYDVFEERNGYGRIGAGRWIALEYTQKVGTLTLEERVTALEKAVFGD